MCNASVLRSLATGSSPRPRRVRFLEIEYALPRAAVRDAFARAAAVVERVAVGDQLPGRGARTRAATTSRSRRRPGATPPTSPSTFTAARPDHEPLLPRRRVRACRLRRPSALGEDALPHGGRAARRLPASWARSSRCATVSTPTARSPTPTYDRILRALCSYRRYILTCRHPGSPRRRRRRLWPTSPAMAGGVAGHHGCDPHVKAHKCIVLARRQAAIGHPASRARRSVRSRGWSRPALRTTCCWRTRSSTPRRFGGVVGAGARVTVAGRLRRRCGGPPPPAGCARCSSTSTSGCPGAAALRTTPAVSPILAASGPRRPRRDGLRGSPHARGRRRRSVAPLTRSALALLLAAHADVGGEVVSGGGTGTWRGQLRWVTEMQAGSYALMDSAYAALPGVPFAPGAARARALSSRLDRAPGHAAYAVADVGLKALGMDHGNPSLPGGGERLVLLRRAHDLRCRGRREPLAGRGPGARRCPRTSTRPVALHERMHLVRRRRGPSTPGRSTCAGGDPLVRPSLPLTAHQACPPRPIGYGRKASCGRRPH